MKRLALSLFLVLALHTVAQTPLNLQQCIARATERNLQMQQAELARRQQEIGLNSSKNARLPHVSASVGEHISFGRGLTANNTYEARNTSSASFSVGASMPLYTGGRIGHERERARLNLAAATADVERLRENLSLQVAQAYLQTLYLADVVTQSEENLRLAERQAVRLRQAIASGKKAEVEAAEAAARIAQDRMALVQAENNHRLALLELSQLLEFPTPDSLAVVRPDESELRPVTGSPDETFLLSVGDRPAIRAADLRIKAAEREVGIARTDYLPKLSLNAGIGTNYYNTSGVNNMAFGRQLKDNFSQSIGLSLNIPIFNAHTTRNNVRSARLALFNRQLQREEEKKALFKEIQNAFYNARAAEQKYKAAKAAETAAETALAAVTRKYENGKANGTEFDEARHKHFNAATDRIAARYEFLFRTKILDFYRGEALQ